MTLEGQNPQIDRYSLIPRTLNFLLWKDQVLLMPVAEAKGAWAGKLNGVGGHIERGESPQQSARREILEETGLEPQNLKLCGMVIVDTERPLGISLHIFVGEATGQPTETNEGTARWEPLSGLVDEQLVADIPTILPAALAVYREQTPPFTALYSYTPDGSLIIEMDQTNHE